MGIFGNFSNNKKETRPTLASLVDKYFMDGKLVEEIHIYLAMRRQQHDMPARISFEKQLELLATYPEDERIKQVQKSILGGYRSLCYPRKGKYKNPQKAVAENILEVGF